MTTTTPGPVSGRRSFLSAVVLAVQAAIGAAITFVVGGAALAPSFASQRRSWQRAASVGEITDALPTPITLRLIRQDGYRQVVERRVVYIQKTGAGVRVLDSTCTHLGCRTRFDAPSKRIVCPCHGGAYDLDGTVVDGPPPSPLRQLDARIDGTDVVVRI